jgi:hypothetical protein
MKTIEEILSNYEEEWATFLDDRFGARLCQFLTKEQIESIGFSINEEYKGQHVPKEWTRENILEQLKDDVEFGFEKALDRRGISSGLMFDVVRKWNKVLEEGLENWDEDHYAMYGLPLFKATAVKYGWDNPIGDDEGNESEYGDE